MIGYTTLGTNDIARASAFYDALLADMGAKRLMQFGDGFIGYGANPKQPIFCICKPHNGETATRGNGTMVALAVKDPAQADALHAKALTLGATDEGAPGKRGDSFYCAYVRDLDGNKLNFFCMV